MTTLAEAQTHPFLSRMDFSGVSVKALAANLKQRLETEKDPSRKPESSALRFYLLNHAYSELGLRLSKSQVLTHGPKDLVDHYLEAGTEEAMRMLSYLTLICTRESRHLTNKDSVHEELVSKFGTAYTTFLGTIQGKGREGAVNKFTSSPPDMEFGKYTEAMEYVFFHGAWLPGYGGKAWGEIARTLRRFATGEFSAEMMLDTGFTLAHNHGPIFNKGMLYGSYSDMLAHILDVQRAGMIPQFLEEQSKGLHYMSSSLITPDVLVAVSHVKRAVPALFEQSMDWDQVSALGALSSVSSFKKAQTKFYGGEVPKPTPTTAKAKAAAAEANKKYYFITPTEKVEITPRKKKVAA